MLAILYIQHASAIGLNIKTLSVQFMPILEGQYEYFSDIKCKAISYECTS